MTVVCSDAQSRPDISCGRPLIGVAYHFGSLPTSTTALNQKEYPEGRVATENLKKRKISLLEAKSSSILQTAIKRIVCSERMLGPQRSVGIL
jgi:hypothetical protein